MNQLNVSLEEKCPVNSSRIQIHNIKGNKKGRREYKVFFFSPRLLLPFYLVFSRRLGVFLFFWVLSGDHVCNIAFSSYFLLFIRYFYSSQMLLKISSVFQLVANRYHRYKLNFLFHHTSHVGVKKCKKRNEKNKSHTIGTVLVWCLLFSRRNLTFVRKRTIYPSEKNKMVK